MTITIPRYLLDRTDGASSVRVPGTTVSEGLEALIRKYPGLEGEILDPKGRILFKWLVYINDKAVKLSEELSHPVGDEDVLKLIPVIDGG